MAIEAKEILEVLGIEAADAAEFNAKFHGTYISKKNAEVDPDLTQKVTGTAFRRVTGELKKAFGLTEADVKDKKLEDLFPVIQERYKTQIDELTATSKGKGGDEELKKKIEALTTDKLNLEKQFTELGKTLEEERGGFKKKLTETQINTAKASAFGKLNFSEDYRKDPLKQKGFQSELNDAYDFVTDEESNSIRVKDKKTGNFIMNPKNASQFADVDTAISILADTNKLLSKNDLSKKRENFEIGGDKKPEFRTRKVAHDRPVRVKE